MNFSREARHLLSFPWRARRAFPRSTLLAIERAIEESERSHGAQIRFAVEGSLHGKRLLHRQSARERGLELFSVLRMWDTELRNGVLIYVLLADQAVEIIADRGAHAKIGSPPWQEVCREMQTAFSRGDYRKGAVEGVHAISQHLGRHFPARKRDNELPDRPVVL
jgi:uncharacterized membrane protein